MTYPGIYFPLGKTGTQPPFPTFELPFRQDFTAMLDGNLTGEWLQNANTFQVSSGRMVNVPNAILIPITDYSLQIDQFWAI